MVDRMAEDSTIAAVASLDDDLRRGMYAYIRAARRPVTRQEAAAAVGISRKLAAFHLDKLVTSGLLTSGYHAVGGPRVGRAPKVYEPAAASFQVSIPDRRYDALADILVDAVLVDDGEGGSSRDTAVEIAARRGHEAGVAERQLSRPGRLGAERALTMAERVLARLGFEPGRDEPNRVRLRNCPFHPLAARAPELVCRLNLAFVDGVLDGLEGTRLRAELRPTTGECCVEIETA